MNKTIGILVTGFLLSVGVHAQHDQGRGAVRLLAKGKTEAAINMAASTSKKKNSSIDEAEHEFVLAMAECQRGDAEAAFVHAKRAVKLGLPIGRFKVGPDGIFDPLLSHKEYVAWLDSQGSMLVHGPMLGDVTAHSAKFWVRTAVPTNIHLVVGAEGYAQITTNVHSLTVNDNTAILNIEGLRPNTEYEYRLVLGDEWASGGRFQTFPEEGVASKFDVVFGGCAGYTPEYEHVWSVIKSYNAKALLMLGDNVYIDDPSKCLTGRYCYYRRHSQPDWRSLVGSIPVYSIWDDHDFAWDDCNAGPDIENPPWKRDVWNVFKQNWNNPPYAGGESQPGCWFDFYIGDVHFIMLDCRYYRHLEGGTMLGPVQKKWLKKTLANSKGRFKMLASSVPFSAGVKGGSRDTWDGFPEEREELFSFIESEEIDGVVLMAADRHRSDMRRTVRSEGYDFYELMSARLTNVHTHPMMDEAKGSEFIMGYTEKCSFGLLEFDTSADDPTVTYNIINIENEKVGSRTLNLSELSHRKSNEHD